MPDPENPKLCKGDHEIVPTAVAEAADNIFICTKCELVLTPGHIMIGVYQDLIELFGENAEIYIKVKSVYARFVEANKTKVET